MRTDRPVILAPEGVAGYSGRDHALINADRLGMDWFFAEGNIVSDLDDLSRWALFPDGKLLKAKSLSRMFSVKKLSDGSNGKFGYGWFIDTGNPKIVYHSGHTPGFSAFVYRDATRNIAVVMLFNNDSVPTAGLLEAAKKLDSYNW